MAQASRLIPEHIFAPIGGPTETVKLEGSDLSLPGVSEFSDLRLPASLQNCIRVQQMAFEPSTYSIEPTVQFKTEKGVLTEKNCPVTNFIRYKFVDGTDAETEKLTNEVGLVASSKTGKVSLAVLTFTDGQQHQVGPVE